MDGILKIFKRKFYSITNFKCFDVQIQQNNGTHRREREEKTDTKRRYRNFKTKKIIHSAHTKKNNALHTIIKRKKQPK